jgi:hypothetical protein
MKMKSDGEQDLIDGIYINTVNLKELTGISMGLSKFTQQAKESI